MTAIVDRIDNWLVKNYDLMQQSPNFIQERLTLMAALLWQIWKWRNDIVFNRKEPDPSLTLHRASILAVDYIGASI